MRKYTLVQFINTTAVKRSTYKQLNLSFRSKTVLEIKPCYNEEDVRGNYLFLYVLGVS